MDDNQESAVEKVEESEADKLKMQLREYPKYERRSDGLLKKYISRAKNNGDALAAKVMQDLMDRRMKKA